MTGGTGMVGLTPLGILSSTETLVDGSDAWTEKGHLPVAVSGLRGVSLNNNIIITGNIRDNTNFYVPIHCRRTRCKLYT